MCRRVDTLFWNRAQHFRLDSSRARGARAPAGHGQSADPTRIWCSWVLTPPPVVWSYATRRNKMKPHQVTSSGIKIAGTTYLLATDLARQMGVSRTTLYR